MKTILLTHHLIDDGLEELLASFRVIRPAEGGMHPKEALKLIPECDAVVPLAGLLIDRATIDTAPHLELIATYGVGYDHVDVDYARSRGITVANTPDAVTEPTAELAFGLMLALARRISELDRKFRDPVHPLRWGVMNDLGTGLYGKTLGIVGMGRIGQAVARRAVASGMRIVYSQRTRLPEETERKYEAAYLPLEELLAVSDVVSLHVPSSGETHHLLHAGNLATMKPGAFVVNTARGALIDEQALTGALRQGVIAGAALDVFEHEPHPLPELLTMDQVILSPHHGTHTLDARIAMNRHLSENILHFFRGSGPVTVVG